LQSFSWSLQFTVSMLLLASTRINTPILQSVTGHWTGQHGAAETTASDSSMRLAVLDWQAKTLPTFCYIDTSAASTHSFKFSSFAVLPMQKQIHV